MAIQEIDLQDREIVTSRAKMLYQKAAAEDLTFPCVRCNMVVVFRPETCPTTQDQLVNEVEGIYAGLVMARRSCL
jgi:hypothetical protein